ncbi:MAG: OmpA family protein [Bacteroidales bacterium]
MPVPKFTLLFFIILWGPVALGQTDTLHPRHSDCSGAILLSDTVYGPTTAPLGPGKEMEISGNPNSQYAFHREHHTVWYKFVAPADGRLAFTIIPLAIEDDYDFLLYKKEGANFCKKIKNDKVKPVRSNISRNNKTIDSKTGIRRKAKHKFVNQGPGDDFSKDIKISKNDTFLLVLDNVYKNGEGHILKLHYDLEEKTDTIPDKPTKKKDTTNQQHVIITMKDKKSGELINARIKIGYPKSDKVFMEKKDISQLTTKLEPKTEYTITAKAENYFREIKRLKTPETDSILHVNIDLTKIEKGNNLTLKNLYFYPGTANFKRDSYETLRNLLNIMEENPDLKIAIHGHVNQPHQWKDKSSQSYLQNLSERRAEAVKRYLKRRGIKSDRMTTEGFSNREMINPYARTEEEMQENRRVEIVVRDI